MCDELEMMQLKPFKLKPCIDSESQGQITQSVQSLSDAELYFAPLQ